MAGHKDEMSMLRESLPEFLLLARLGITHRKADGGVLGYPSALLLLAVVDALGSYFRDDSTFTVQVDGTPRRIAAPSDHILILNSEFFGCAFSEAQLRDLYGLLRSPLTHNAVIGLGHVLVPDSIGPAFEFRDGRVVTNLRGLLEACEAAVEVFLEIGDWVVPDSQAIAELRRKAAARATH